MTAHELAQRYNVTERTAYRWLASGRTGPARSTKHLRAAIRERVAAGATYRTVANEFGVSLAGVHIYARGLRKRRRKRRARPLPRGYVVVAEFARARGVNPGRLWKDWRRGAFDAKRMTVAGRCGVRIVAEKLEVLAWLDVARAREAQ